MARHRTLAAYGAAAVMLAAAPYALDPSPLSTLGRILFYALLAASLDLLVGVGGLPSLGHAAPYGVGAYTAALVAKHVTVVGPVQFVCAIVAGAAVAALTGWLFVRSNGVYLLMLTLAVGMIVFQLAGTWESVTGGFNGLYGVPGVHLAGGALIAGDSVYWYVLGGFVVGYALLAIVCASPFGRALRGIRDNEARMRSLGYPTALYKYGAFCIAGGVAGAAGSLLVAHERLVAPADAGLSTAIVALLAVVIGGAGSLWGPCVGAAIVVLVRDSIGANLGGHGPLLLGLVFITCVYLLPRGIAGVRLPTTRTAP